MTNPATMTVQEKKEVTVPRWVWLFVVLYTPTLMYVVGIYTGWRLYRHPTAHVEVQSNPKEAP